MTANIKRTLYNFAVTFLVLGCSLAVILITTYRLNISLKKNTLLEKEVHTLEILEKLSRIHFSSLRSDIHLLGSMPFPTDSPRGFTAQEDFLLKFATSKKIYQQVRYIDMQGQERIRVNYSGRASLVPQKQLQNKAQRYYFKAGIMLPPNTIYTSPLDLNVEHGEVEIPYKPMLRLVTPVRNNEGKPSGVIVLNYLADRYLQELKTAENFSFGNLYLLNQNGQFLLHKNEQKRWSFMFPNRPSEGIFNDEPEVWQNMLYSEKNQLETEQGVYTYLRIVPFGHIHNNIDNKLLEKKRYWTLYSLIPAPNLHAATTFSSRTMTITVAFLLIIVSLISVHMAFFLNRRRYFRARLQELAHYDALTGLVNRILLREHMQTALLNMKRYGHRGALLYLDLDGFKPVNDTFGHETGDVLLKAVGRRLKSSCRATDSVARVGGDEFVILLPQVKGEKGAETLTRKIIKQLNIPFTIKQHKIIIGTSIGVTMMSKNNMNIDELISKADQAMYVAKRAGKNTYRFSREENHPSHSNVISIHKH